MQRLAYKGLIYVALIFAVVEMLGLNNIVRNIWSKPRPNDNWAEFKNDLFLNEKRVEQAKTYFKRQNKSDMVGYYHSLLTSSSIYMSVTIATVNRSYMNTNGPGYLIQSAAALDTFARSSVFINRTFVFVCNVDHNPSNHSDATFLGNYLPFTERYGASSFDISSPVIPGTMTTYREKQNNDTYEKQTYDYMYCLKVAQSLNSKYILMVEDDAIAHKDLSQVLKFFLEDHTSLKRQKQFGFLKLYYPTEWQGFSLEFQSVLELISIGVIGGGLSVFCRCVSSCFCQRRASIKIYQRYFLSGMLVLMFSASMLGRQNLLEVRRLSRYLYQLRPSPGCCIPAMLYPRSSVNPLLNHLAKSTKRTDLAIEDIILQTRVPAYYIEPNLFYHIGMFTSLKQRDRKKKPDEFLFYI